MITYTIYEHPKDHPIHYVVRRWWVDKRGELTDLGHMLFQTLEEARQMIPSHMSCFKRNHNDDPVIVETWI